MNAMPTFKQPCAYLVWVTRGTPARVLLYPSRNLKLDTGGAESGCIEIIGVTAGIDPTTHFHDNAVLAELNCPIRWRTPPGPGRRVRDHE